MGDPHRSESRRPHSRRTFLAGLASTGVALAAGCAQAPSQEPATPSPQQGQQGQTGANSPYARVYRQTIDSVAILRAYRSGGDSGQASAFAVGENRLVTNHHVVQGTDAVHVGFTDGSWREATVRGSDVYSDLAVLSVPSLPDQTTPLELARADPAIGQEVVALGSPFGLQSSVSSGIVSGVDRSLPGPGGFDIPDAIQTDAAVNPGNSGGPLVDFGGRVRGVVTAGGGENVGFAISSALARRVVPALATEGEYDHSLMGVALRDVTPAVAEPNDVEPRGVIVVAILQGGPSDGVLRGSPESTRVRGVEVPVGGDVIRQLDDQPIDRLSDLSTYLALETSPGQTMGVTVLRDGNREQVQLTLGERPPPP